VRETVRSDDDVALEAARSKLVSLATRPGYLEAMSPAPGGSRMARDTLLVLATGFVGLAIVCFQRIAAAWLGWLLLVFFLVLGAFTALAAVGVGPAKAPRAIGAVITAKLPDLKLALLCDDGSQHEVTTHGTLHASVKVGDVGVAHLRPETYVVEFHRL
jgi:hypothetical protein